jgi:hypothetical protein
MVVKYFHPENCKGQKKGHHPGWDDGREKLPVMLS